MPYEKERDMNPPEFKDEFEPDWDSINDEEWLRKRQEQEDKESKCYNKGDCK